MRKINILFFLSIFIVIASLFLYIFNIILTPTIIAVADAEVRAKSSQKVNEIILEQYSKQFNYDEIIHVDKDNEGNIVLLKADTLKMNRIACSVAIDSQKKLNEMGKEGIDIPLGYVFKNNFLSYLGPSVKVKMHPIGNIETTYISEFESAGINQTRHKIYVSFKAKVKIILPVKSNEVEIINQVPISETIIVGKIPNTSVQLDLDSAGYKLNNKANRN